MTCKEEIASSPIQKMLNLTTGPPLNVKPLVKFIGGSVSWLPSFSKSGMSDETLPKNEENNEPVTEGENPPLAGSLALDLGDDCVYNVEANRLGSQAPSAAGASVPEPSNSSTKSEENPFSFKHFLKEGTSSKKNYQSLGARPKVFRESRSRHVTPPESPQRPPGNRKIGEFSSALPDFVQDHLVIEQCFLGSKPNTVPEFNLDLPDFAQADQRPFNGPTVSRSNSLEEPSIQAIPLDLPGLSLGNAFPLDLPLSANPPVSETRNNTPLAEVGNSKSLPDFLTDGPVRSSADATTPSPSPFVDEALRTTARCRQCAEMTAELTGVRQRLGRAEDEVERNFRRATVAENTVTRLKQELKVLKSQLRQLQGENQALREGGAGAVGGGGGEPVLELPGQRLAQELRAAASTAEHSLRSLLTGVDNLRIMASTLENMHRIEEKRTDMFSRFDDDRAGPAL